MILPRPLAQVAELRGGFGYWKSSGAEPEDYSRQHGVWMSMCGRELAVWIWQVLDEAEGHEQVVSFLDLIMICEMASSWSET